MQEELLTAGEAADLKGVSVAAVYAAVKQGRLPHQKVLNRIAIRRADVEVWEPIAYAGRPGAKPRGGRPSGTHLSAETRAKLSEAAKRRWARRGEESEGSA